jgi:long-chain acyl-CoA synthetase
MNNSPWLDSYAKYGIEETIDPNKFPSVLHLLEEAMHHYSENIAYIHNGTTLSFRELDEQSKSLAAWLQIKLGIEKGDRIAVQLPNILEFPIALLALVRIGAIQVNVNPLYSASELEHQLSDAGCKTIIMWSGALPKLLESLDRTVIDNVLVVGQRIGPVEIDPRLSVFVPFEEVLRQGVMLRPKPVLLTGDDLIFLQYTGGTTGVSKGAALSHRNLIANIEQFKCVAKDSVRPGVEVQVTAIPLYHIFALMGSITYLSIGSTNWLVDNPRNLDSLIDVLDTAKPSVFFGVNTLYAALANHPKTATIDFSNLRTSIGGGAAVLPATSAKWEQLTGRFIREGYGLSETSPLVSFNPSGINFFTNTTGIPVPNTQIKLLDNNGNEVPLGKSGEICVRGPQVMSNYWNASSNNDSFTEDGFFRTGDIGSFNQDGFLKIVDRKKDMIIVSGFNVFPNEIESVIGNCAGVLESACVGTLDEKTGEAVRVYIVKAPFSDLSEYALIEHCRRHLAAYKIPKHVSFVEDLPKSSVGKILRRQLRDI